MHPLRHKLSEWARNLVAWIKRERRVVRIVSVKKKCPLAQLVAGVDNDYVNYITQFARKIKESESNMQHAAPAPCARGRKGQHAALLIGVPANKAGGL